MELNDFHESDCRGGERNTEAVTAVANRHVFSSDNGCPVGTPISGYILTTGRAIMIKEFTRCQFKPLLRFSAHVQMLPILESGEENGSSGGQGR